MPSEEGMDSSKWHSNLNARSANDTDDRGLGKEVGSGRARRSSPSIDRMVRAVLTIAVMLHWTYMESLSRVVSPRCKSMLHLWIPFLTECNQREMIDEHRILW